MAARGPFLANVGATLSDGNGQPPRSALWQLATTCAQAHQLACFIAVMRSANAPSAVAAR